MTRTLHFLSLYSVLLLLPFTSIAGNTAQNVNPEQQITTDQLVGLWELQGTAQKIDGDRNTEHQSWEFRADGMLKSVVEDRRADGTIALTVKYKLEKNTLLVQRAGRMNRWKKFQIVKVTDRDLIIRGGIEGYMFFKRKK